MKYIIVESKEVGNIGTIKAYLKENKTFPKNFTLEFFLNIKFEQKSTTDIPIFEYELLNDSQEVVPVKIYLERNSSNFVFVIDDKSTKIFYSIFNKLWNHIAMTYSRPNSIIFYLNGELLIGKNTDKMNFIDYTFKDFLFHVYSASNKFNITGIKIYDHIRYGGKFIPIYPDTTPSVIEVLEDTGKFVVEINNSGIDSIKDTLTDFNSTSDRNLMYLPMKESVIKDTGILGVTWNGYSATYNSGGVLLHQHSGDESGFVSNYTSISNYEKSINIYDKTYMINTMCRRIEPGGLNGFEGGASRLIALKSNETIQLKEYSKFTIDFFFEYKKGSVDIYPINYTDNTNNHALNIKLANDTSGHYAITYNSENDDTISYYLNGKLISTSKLKIYNTLEDKRLNLLFSKYLSSISASQLYISDIRIIDKLLYTQDFDVSQELFESQTIDLESPSTTLKNKNILLLYPMQTPTNNHIYSRGYSSNVSAKFNPEIDSTKYIKYYEYGNFIGEEQIPTIIENKQLSDSIWSSYPIIGSNLSTEQETSLSENHRDNKIIMLRLGKTLLNLSEYCVEFWVYTHLNQSSENSNYKDIAYISTTTKSIGIKINSAGLLKVVTSLTSPNLTDILASTSGKIYSSVELINKWNHISFVHSGNSLLLYINGELIHTESKWDNYLHRIFLMTKNTDDFILPLFTGLKVVKTKRHYAEFNTPSELALV